MHAEFDDDDRNAPDTKNTVCFKFDLLVPKSQTHFKTISLVVSIHLRNISQIGSFPQIGVNTKSV